MTGAAIETRLQVDDDLPEGWTLTTIGRAFQLNPPKPRKDAFSRDTPVSFVPMPAVDAEMGTIATPTMRPFSEVRNGYTAFRDGDVIMAKITPCMENGKAAIVRDMTNGLGFGSTEFHVFRPNGRALPEYLFYYIRQESFRAAAEAEMTGSVGQRRVPAHFLADAPIPLPPLEEQQRIVVQAEALLTRVNEAHDRLTHVPSIMKRFREAVLAAACSGRLTQDWVPTIGVPQSASDSVESVATAQVMEFPELPAHWSTTTLSAVAELIQYGLSVKADALPVDGLPILRMGNIQDGRIRLDHLKHVHPEATPATFLLRRGDMLFNRTNSPELVGKAAVFDVDLMATFASYLVRVRCDPTVVSSKFLCFWINSVWGKEWAAAVKTDGVSQSNINATKLAQMLLPLPPPEEQVEIVRRVEALLGLADEIEGRVTVGSAMVSKLTQAVLAKAFRGELVPTDAELASQEHPHHDLTRPMRQPVHI